MVFDELDLRLPFQCGVLICWVVLVGLGGLLESYLKVPSFPFAVLQLEQR